VSERKEQFARDGVLVIRNFYDLDRSITPILHGIRHVVELVARRHGVVVPCATPEEAMVKGYASLIAQNRKWGSEVYDAIKHIPAFTTLVGDPRNAELFRELRPGSLPGMATGGAGMRIDNPGEEKYRTHWHQEFPAQLRSVDGVVFWSPLLAMTEAAGPVQIAVGSHKEGMIPVYDDDGGVNKTGGYALRLDGEEERLARYRRIAPLTNPGDLVLLDFLTLHRSGTNTADRARWTMQFRYFNFLDPVGIDISWRGSFAAGEKFGDILPQLVARRGDSK
jgi:ectoine hydroxylase-related dioxygenase (phytanoyl-CoA dioxygenase family)